jgi:cell division protein FtsQ
MWDDAKALRRLANTLFGIGLLLLLIGVAYYVVHLPIFPLRAATLTAAPERVSAEQVARVVREELRGNFFTADLEHLRQSLEALPWVRKVSLRRDFPWQVQIALEEHRAVGHWNETGLVNSFGEVFSAETDAVLPDFYGPEGTSVTVAQQFGEFSQRIAPMQRPIVQISLSPRRAWRIRLEDGMVIELGSEEAAERLAKFVAVHRYALATSSPVSYVDLRYRNGFAAYLPGGAAQPASRDGNG